MGQWAVTSALGLCQITKWSTLLQQRQGMRARTGRNKRCKQQNLVLVRLLSEASTQLDSGGHLAAAPLASKEQDSPPLRTQATQQKQHRTELVGRNLHQYFR